MQRGIFCSYVRVSTQRQGASGLGLQAQQASVLAYLGSVCGRLLAEFSEVESGADNSRPELQRAIAYCRVTGASLVIASLSRLSRDPAFLFGLEATGITIVCADNPNMNSLTFGIMAVVAREERQLIAERTRAALRAAKARGQRLGGYRGHLPPDPTHSHAVRRQKAIEHADRVRPIARELRDEGKSLRQIAAELGAKHVQTLQGGRWSANSVRQILATQA